MTVKKEILGLVGDTLTKELTEAIQKKVAAYPGSTPVTKAFALRGEPQGKRVSRLFDLVSDSIATTERVARVAEITDTLRRELPHVFDQIPLKARHLGFNGTEDLIKHLGDILLTMQTRAKTQAEFAAGLKGWRWRLEGVLLERLVKNHPQLNKFFPWLATEFVRLVNEDISHSTLVNVHNKQPKILSRFTAPSKVMGFSLADADGIEHDYTDFGFTAHNREGWYVLLPIELKMPRALAKVADQFSQFEPRLQTARMLFAHVDDGGKQIKVEIDPSRLLFMRHDRAQIAVTPLSIKQAQQTLPSGSKIPPGKVASVIEFEPRASESRQVMYYQIRLLVNRDWLEAIIRPITDPPKR